MKAMIVAGLLLLLTACASASSAVSPATMPHQLGQVQTDTTTVAPPVAAPVAPMVIPAAVAAPAKKQPFVQTVGVSLPLQKLDSFIAATGSTPAQLSIYQQWVNQPAFDSVAASAAKDKGMSIVVTWESWAPACDCANQPAYSDKVIAGGTFDAYIKSYAAQIKTFGGPVMIRLDHEMNGNWYPWGVGVNGNTAADYAAMWRHVHDIFTQEHVTNVSWEWAPNDAYEGDTNMAASYPGDAYVDAVGLSGYNWGTTSQWNTWRSFSSLYAQSLDLLHGIAPSKPLYLAEIASSSIGGNKAAWMTDMFAQVKARPYIAGLVWFDEDGYAQDWVVENNPAVIAAWKAGVTLLTN